MRYTKKFKKFFYFSVFAINYKNITKFSVILTKNLVLTEFLNSAKILFELLIRILMHLSGNFI